MKVPSTHLPEYIEKRYPMIAFFVVQFIVYVFFLPISKSLAENYSKGWFIFSCAILILCTNKLYYRVKEGENIYHMLILSIFLPSCILIYTLYVLELFL